MIQNFKRFISALRNIRSTLEIRLVILLSLVGLCRRIFVISRFFFIIIGMPYCLIAFYLYVLIIKTVYKVKIPVQKSRVQTKQTSIQVKKECQKA